VAHNSYIRSTAQRLSVATTPAVTSSVFDPASFDPALPRYPTIVHALWAAEREHPDGIALVCGDRRLSYADLASDVRRVRGRLLSLGVRGKRVAILLPSSIEAVVTVLGAMSAGAVAALVNPFFSAPELRVVLRDADPSVLLVTPEAAAKVAGVATELGLPATESEGLNDLAVRVFSAPDSKPGTETSASDPVPDDPALLIFTGGTTGEPKAVSHAHRSLMVSVLQHVSAWPLERRRERFLSAAPVFHIWGLEYATLVPIYAQGTHVIVSKYDPDVVLEAIERERITVFGGGPAPIYMGLMQVPRFATTDFSTLAYSLTGGAPCPEELHREWRQRTGSGLLEGWGMSETGPLCLNPVTAPRLGSVGRPVIGTEVEAVDVEGGGRILPVGEAGELRVRGPQLMLGYRGNPEATAAAVRDGWLYTGDIGYVDEDGYVFLVDRKKEMIIVGGYNVYPRSVDEVLFKHPKVAEAATVGRPHARLGEVLVAFVVPKPGVTLDEEEFFAYCSENLVKYRRPVSVTFLDSLPRTNARKVDKKTLRAMAGLAMADSKRIDS
jgi:long-chain acyl-CoA synthetase